VEFAGSTKGKCESDGDGRVGQVTEGELKAAPAAVAFARACLISSVTFMDCESSLMSDATLKFDDSRPLNVIEVEEQQHVEFRSRSSTPRECRMKTACMASDALKYIRPCCVFPSVFYVVNSPTSVRRPSPSRPRNRF
jgi:hypothetical protein